MRYPHTEGMAIGRPTKPLNLTADEREKLALLARRPKTAQAMAMRARIVLGCDEGLSNGAVAKKLQITGATVCKWRERFRVNPLEGLLDEPSRVLPGRSRTSRWRLLSPRPWNRCPLPAPTGARGSWRKRR